MLVKKLHILKIMKILLSKYFILFILLCSSCKQIEYVNKSEIETKIIYDSIYIDNYKYVENVNDTFYIKDSIRLYYFKSYRDTIIKYDSVFTTKNIIKEREVVDNQYKNRFYYSIIIILILLIILIYKIKYK
jgi:hypothetical protein